MSLGVLFSGFAHAVPPTSLRFRPFSPRSEPNIDYLSLRPNERVAELVSEYKNNTSTTTMGSLTMFSR